MTDTVDGVAAIRSWAVRALVTFAAYMAVGWPSVAWLHRVASRFNGSMSNEVAVPWFATGIALICLIRFGRPALLGIALGSAALWGGVHLVPLPVNVIEAIGEALSIASIVWLLNAAGFRMHFDRFRDPIILLVAVALGRLVASSVDALGVVVAAWFTSDSALIADMTAAGATRVGDSLAITPQLYGFPARWWLNTVTGCVLVAPLFATSALLPRPLARRDYAEAALLVSASILWMSLALTFSGPASRPLLLMSAMALVVWATVRFGVRAAAALTLADVAIATDGFARGIGAFGGVAPSDRLTIAWGFIGLLSGSALFLTALLGQRERTKRTTAASAERYRRLFIGCPFPMWGEDPVSGQILFANPAALRAYDYDEPQFSRLQSRHLQAGTGDLLGQRRSGDATVTMEQHRTRLGTILDVETTRLTITFDGRPVRIVFVELQSERNALRQATLSAGDVERFRLAGTLRDQLLPLLLQIVAATDGLQAAESGVNAHQAVRSISKWVGTAVETCRKLTRGASPLEDAGGDLAESLRRLPATLEQTQVTIDISVPETVPQSLPIERRDHIYRFVEDAVRIAVSRDGVSVTKVTLACDDRGITVSIEDDGALGDSQRITEDLARRAIVARAAAAGGELRISEGNGRGTTVVMTCRTQRDERPDAAARVANDAAPAGQSPAERHRAQRTRLWSRSARLPLRLAALTAAICLAELIGVWFLRASPSVEAAFSSTTALPWIASGVGLVGLLVGGAELWPAILVAHIIVWRGITQYDWTPVLADAAAETIATVLTVDLLYRFGFSRQCSKLRDFLYLAAAAAIGQAVVACVYVMALQLADPAVLSGKAAEFTFTFGVTNAYAIAISASTLEHGFRWWLSGVAGIVLLVPPCLSWSRDVLARLRAHPGAFLVWLLAVLLTNAALLAAGDPGWQPLILMLELAVITWASAQFGVAVASAATLLAALAATASFGLDRGALAPAQSGEGGAVLWGFIVLLVGAAQILNMLLAENEQAERELRERDLRYRSLFEAIPHAVFACTAGDGHILLANRAATRLYGYSAAEFHGRSLGSLAADATPSGAAVDAADASDPSRTTARHLTKSGTSLDIELSSIAVDTGDEASTFWFAVDVTERNRLRTRMFEETDSERRELAREFHDGLGQILTGLGLGLSSLLRSVERNAPLVPSDIQFVSDVAHEACRTCELILGGVSPLQEVDGDLLEAIGRLPDRLPPESRGLLSVSVTAISSIVASLEKREHLYQITQEAVTNSLKHAQAQHISVAVAVSPSVIKITVADDGVGIDSSRPSGGLGLESLRLRAAALGAQLNVAQRKTGGTRVVCICPQSIV